MQTNSKFKYGKIVGILVLMLAFSGCAKAKSSGDAPADTNETSLKDADPKVTLTSILKAMKSN